MLNGDWAGYISSGAPQEKHIPLFFVQGMLIGQAPGAYRSFEGRFNDRSATDMGLAVQHTPPGSYAVARVEGPYPMERPVGSALMGEWLPSSGYKYRGGPMIELYLTTLDEVRDEKKLVTEICVPVTRS
jgi:effector-binding domain-containing protein